MSSESGKRTKEEAYCMARNERMSSNKEINLSFYIKAVFLGFPMQFPKLW